MKKLLLPLVLLLAGTGGGVGAGLFLAPPPAEDMADNSCGEIPASETGSDTAAAPAPDTDPDGSEYARLNNQFVVPVIEEGRVAALVVLSLSVEVPVGGKEFVFTQEPKLRDVFLQVLFDHANIGGFEGAFTSSRNMGLLRTALRDSAIGAVGDRVLDVMIVDIVRQDVQ
ncbi:flagellar basal body-associated protein FliL [Octadecabacter sp. SW4]|uniref:flagellar basal body-associated protein FliL n=1 Tax=Octadecabacter sp. SW4 TaxID=2602067 RepID=UPI0011C20B83|nr:flagellar basal body-associated protein FliL [Octadecabacter sp. SW4]QEE37158.1 flagellar basal body-associated protein FliL [Octadecabacter sp. SW4]